MRRFTGPFALAIIVTLANAAKPVVVDDTAYLAYARHIAQHPLDPYGFTIHWYTFPEPAMDVLAPPVLPYWLALGIGLFGEHIFLLKLWLFPFLWCFTYSLDVLLRRFARGTERFALPLIVLSPAVLPTVNLMLDIPAAALGLAALAMFMAACDRDDWKRAMLAGLIAGLAMQTKYTGLVATAAILWYGFLTRRKIRPTIVAGAVAAMIFVAWEGLLLLKYGESHFLHHLAEQREASGSLWHWWGEKLDLLPGLAGHLGCLGIAIALLAAHSLGLSNRRTVIVAVFWSLFVALVLLTPGVAIRARNVWRPVGTFALIAALSCAYVLWVHRKPLRLRPPKFVIGWVLLELAGYFALTPFPAARRVIGYTIASGVLVARLASRRQRIDSARAPPRWLLAFGISIGCLSRHWTPSTPTPKRCLRKGPRNSSAVRSESGSRATGASSITARAPASRCSSPVRPWFSPVSASYCRFIPTTTSSTARTSDWFRSPRQPTVSNC